MKHEDTESVTDTHLRDTARECMAEAEYDFEVARTLFARRILDMIDQGNRDLAWAVCSQHAWRVLTNMKSFDRTPTEQEVEEQESATAQEKGAHECPTEPSCKPTNSVAGTRYESVLGKVDWTPLHDLYAEFYSIGEHKMQVGNMRDTETQLWYETSVDQSRAKLKHTFYAKLINDAMQNHPGELAKDVLSLEEMHRMKLKASRMAARKRVCLPQPATTVEAG